MPASRTPEGTPASCVVCGAAVVVEPSLPAGDAPCPRCGTLLWFVRAADSVWLTDQPLHCLQDLDRDIYALRSERASTPAALCTLRLEHETLVRLGDEAENEVEAYRSKQRLLEADVESHEERIAEIGRRLSEACGNEEYRALLRDLDVCRAQRRYVEERILETMEQIEEACARVTEIHGQSGRTRERLDAEEREVREIRADIAEELGNLERARREMVAQVPPDLLARYERVRSRPRSLGQALAAVEERTCTGCYSPLPDRILEALDRYVACPSCGRLLYG